MTRPILPSVIVLQDIPKKREFLKRHRKSILPFEVPLIATKAADMELLESLASDVATGSFFPHPPCGYIALEKSNGVPRFIPSFRVEDAMIYFLCVNSMGGKIGLGRTTNTYGGWTMGNSARTQEESETKVFDDALAASFVPYPFDTSMDPTLFRRIWRDFQRRAFQYSRDAHLQYFARIDIANFFDSINLSFLEGTIRSIMPNDYVRIIDLLFVFLRHWNRGIEGYAAKGTGLPLDEVGDNSRILSNLYLQAYDGTMSEYCQKNSNLRYLRYADDQILMAGSKSDLLMMIRFAAEQLHRIGLSINTGKVEIFDSREEYDKYWCFDLIERVVRDPESGAQHYFSLIDEGTLPNRSRHISVLNALAWKPEQLRVPFKTGRGYGRP